jgi:hypothetical protein
MSTLVPNNICPKPQDQPETISQPPSPLDQELTYSTPLLAGPNCPVADAGVPGPGSLRLEVK